MTVAALRLVAPPTRCTRCGAPYATRIEAESLPFGEPAEPAALRSTSGCTPAARVAARATSARRARRCATTRMARTARRARGRAASAPSGADADEP